MSPLWNVSCWVMEKYNRTADWKREQTLKTIIRIWMYVLSRKINWFLLQEHRGATLRLSSISMTTVLPGNIFFHSYLRHVIYRYLDYSILRISFARIRFDRVICKLFKVTILIIHPLLTPNDNKLWLHNHICSKFSRGCFQWWM